MADILPELEARKDKVFRDSRYNEQQIAVCRISYRPTLWQLFATDVAETLIAAGNASVTSADLSSNESKVVDSSQRIQDLRHDVKYIDKLAKAEFEAAKKSMGMWSVPEVRESKREVVEEVEFQTKANVFQKLWRWFRGG
jgi:endonuclease YncB( thermonuclease family)